MLKVYVAGPYSAPTVIEVLDNMRRGMRLSTEVFLAGMAPFTPWHDYHHQLMLRSENEEQLTVQNYYDYSMEWLKVSDAVLVGIGWENSKGTLAEIAKAEELGIPIFYTLRELQEYNDNR